MSTGNTSPETSPLKLVDGGQTLVLNPGFNSSCAGWLRISRAAEACAVKVKRKTWTSAEAC